MKKINDYENYYVSNNGEVYNSLKKIYCKKYINNKGYEMVSLSKNNKSKTFFIHRLVAQSYINNNDLKLEVNHINSIKTDNRVENLEWVTRSENMWLAYNDNRITSIKHLL